MGSTNAVANLQKIMTRIGGCCLITIGVWIIIELSVQFGHYHHSCRAGVGEWGVLGWQEGCCTWLAAPAACLSDCN